MSVRTLVFWTDLSQSAINRLIVDVGPLYSFWCFSFERYNGILEGMQKTWQAPEIQLFKKVLNLQAILI